MINNKNFYGSDIVNIKNIELLVVSNDDVKKYSVIKGQGDIYGINKPESYNEYIPVKNGLMDSRLGTCDHFMNCTTCGQNQENCPGHFGHVELVEPVYHFNYLEKLKYVLKCICLSCNNILIKVDAELEEKLNNKTNEQRFNIIKNLCKKASNCNNCGAPVPKITRLTTLNSITKFIIEKTVKKSFVDETTGDTKDTDEIIQEEYGPYDCYRELRNVPDKVYELMGFRSKKFKPYDFIATRYPVAPVCIRPTNRTDLVSSTTMENSLTVQLSNIVDYNEKIRVAKQKNNDITDFATCLQLNVSCYYNNKAKALPSTEFKNTNKNTQSISERIKEKKGRFRNNLSGKRVEFSARSVLTPDPYIDIDEVGIPLKVAMNFTIPEEVTLKNLKKLTKLVRNGNNIYPGANRVVRKIMNSFGEEQVQTLELKYNKNNINLKEGDVVLRHAVDGDYVLFNRQPTLHKPSMMAHKIKVLDGVDTFRINISVTDPYNADCDGDEMNIHLAQSVQARNELKRIANVRYNIIGVKHSAPIIACKHDDVIGSYLLSKYGNVNYNIACNMLSRLYTTKKYSIKKTNKLINGNELFSYIIPDGINIVEKNDFGKFIVKDGIIKEGVLNKSFVSMTSQSIVNYIWDKLGGNKTNDFINDAHRLAIDFLNYFGSTIGFGDCYVEKEMEVKIDNFVQTKINEMNVYITEMENDTNDVSPETIENKIKGDLQIINSETEGILKKYLNDDNNLYKFMSSGSKGKISNLSQMMGSLGQIVLDGVRFKRSVNNRSLVCFHEYDDTPDARGFIRNNFFKGLNGIEFFYHSATAREGLINTALKTGKTGYIQRRMIKALEDLKVHYDGTVRNLNNVIIQNNYGTNSIDLTKQTEIKLPFVSYSNDEVKEKLTLSNNEIKELEKKMKIKNLNKINDNFYSELISMRDYLRKVYVTSTMDYKTLQETYKSPVNLYRLSNEYGNDKVLYDLSPEYIINKLDELISKDSLKLNIYDNKMFKNDNKGIKMIFKIGLYNYLSPKKCIFEHKYSKKDFDNLINEIEKTYIKNIVNPGEMIGIVTAQSLGEPVSQMNMNSKHAAGKGGGVSSGLNGYPRIEELINNTKENKVQMMYIYFDDKINRNKNVISEINSTFKYLIIDDVVEQVELLYHLMDDSSIDRKLKKDNVSGDFKYPHDENIDANTLNFVFRFKFNIEKLLERDITVMDIKIKLFRFIYDYNNKKTGKLKKQDKEILDNLSKVIISSNDNIMHFRFSMINFNMNILNDLMSILLNEVALKGLNGINNSFLDEFNSVSFNKKTGEKKEDKEYYIVTEGINYMDLLQMKNVDHTKTYCNNINMIQKLYGIHAARNILLYEMNKVFTDTGNSINPNHFTVLGDFMIHSGSITSIKDSGLSKLKIDPLARASFERATTHLENSAIYNEVDRMISVSSRVIAGQVINGGTGMFKLQLNTDMIKNSELVLDKSINKYDIQLVETDNLITDILKYGINNTDFFIP